MSFAFIPTYSAFAVQKRQLHNNVPTEGVFAWASFVDQQSRHIALSDQTESWIYTQDHCAIQGDSIARTGNTYRLASHLPKDFEAVGWKVVSGDASIDRNGRLTLHTLSPGKIVIGVNVRNSKNTYISTIYKQLLINLPDFYLEGGYIGDEYVVHPRFSNDVSTQFLSQLIYEWGYTNSQTSGIQWERSRKSYFKPIKGEVVYVPKSDNEWYKAGDNPSLPTNVYLRIIHAQDGAKSTVRAYQGGFNGYPYRYGPATFRVLPDGSMEDDRELISFTASRAIDQVSAHFELTGASIEERHIPLADQHRRLSIYNIIPLEDLVRLKNGTLERKVYMVDLQNAYGERLQTCPIVVLGSHNL